VNANPTFATSGFPHRTRFVLVNDRVPRTDGHCGLCGQIIGIVQGITAMPLWPICQNGYTKSGALRPTSSGSSCNRLGTHS
jgi:hypothetical protein